MRARGWGLALVAGGVAAGAGLSAPGCAGVLDIPSERVLGTGGGGQGEGPACSTPVDCKGQGPTYTCSRSPARRGTCVPMTSAECNVVYGLEKDGERAVYLGLLGPMSGESASTGRSTEDAVKMALNEIETSSEGGLPPAPDDASRQPRPVVLIACDDAGDPQVPARHLAEVVGVPAIVGPSFSGDLTQVANNVAVPSNVLLMSASATSVGISNLTDDNLVWRTAPPDTFQAKMFVLLFQQAVDDVRARDGLDAAAPVKAMIVHKADAAGRGLADDIEGDAALVLNGKPPTDPSNGQNYLRFNNGTDAGDTSNPLRTAEAVAAIVARRPHVIFGMLTGEAVGLMKAAEEQWPAGVGYRPRWLFNDGVVVKGLWETIGSNDDLRRRVLLGRPGKIGSRFDTFASSYRGRKLAPESSPEVLGAATGYDATYLLAYALSTLPASASGLEVREKLRQLVGGPGAPVVETGQRDLKKGFEHARQGQKIDFLGVSGELNLNPDTGEGPSDIQLLCLPARDGVAAEAIASGRFLNADTEALSGTFDAQGQCGFTFPAQPAPEAL